MTTIFGRYLIREILPLYLAGLVILMMLLLGVFLLGVLADVIARGASLSLVAQYLLYKLPDAAAYGIPLALLFASLLGFTRLVQDSEVKASLLLGLSPRQFAVPLLTLGLVVSALSFLNNELLVPWSTQRALEVQKDILLQSPETFLEAGNFFTDALGRSVYIEDLDEDGRVSGITVIQSGGSGGARFVIRAERGVLDSEAGVFRLENVRFLRFEDSRTVLDMTAPSAIVPVRRLAAGGVASPELTKIPMSELLARIERLEENGGYRAAAEWTALHRKFAEPLAATAFALFALAVGLYSFKSRAGLGLVSVLFLTFIYYATWSVTRLLGAQGAIPAWLAGWTPVALYAAAALVLLALTWRR